jgi:hypothetical protein
MIWLTVSFDALDAQAHSCQLSFKVIRCPVVLLATPPLLAALLPGCRRSLACIVALLLLVFADARLLLLAHPF